MFLESLCRSSAYGGTLTGLHVSHAWLRFPHQQDVNASLATGHCHGTQFSSFENRQWSIILYRCL